MEETNNRIKWYVMQVMSGQEFKVLKKMAFDCRQDPANVVEEVEADESVPPKFAEEIRKYKGVFRGLFNNIHEIIIPYESYDVRGPKGKETKLRKLYPGYVLLHAELYGEDNKLLVDIYDYIKGINGVISLFGGQYPVPLSDQEAADMTRRQAEASEGKSQTVIHFNIGDVVKISDGAFEGCEATIDGIDAEKLKLKVSVSIFGRSTPVELDFGQVERIEE